MSGSSCEHILVAEHDAPLEGSDTENLNGYITNPFDPSEIRVETRNAQMDALIKRIRRNEIDLAPSFQRQNNVWTKQAQSRLIESLLIRIPLPAFYLDATNEDFWLVVDGLQRLTTIKEFVIDETLELTGLEFLTDYNGATFSKLPRTLQRRIEETPIVMYQIEPGTPKRVKFDIFRRINTGGTPLSAQEIRHALNQGKAAVLLKKLANSSQFKIATANGISPKRMDDRECVLRFLAFSYFSPEEYQSGNFDDFLNTAMEKFNTLPENEFSLYSKAFIQAMERASAIFGNDAFRKRFDTEASRFPINKALFETWSVNLSKLDSNEAETLIQRKELLVSKFITLLNENINFENAITQGTGSTSRVHLRFNQINRIIRETLNDNISLS